ncbi:putative S-adenosylmethionine decarboxylase [Helianthus annuus]|nr:putative S-adenosylmethionine decarboxylase [Helianthus annuus]
MVKKAVKVFCPGTVSVATTSASNDMCLRMKNAVEQLGMKCRSWSMDEFRQPGRWCFKHLQLAGIEYDRKRENMRGQWSMRMVL